MGAPKPPSVPEAGMPPPSAYASTLAGASAGTVMKAQRASAKESKASSAGTIATSPQGDTKAPASARATLLGQ